MTIGIAVKVHDGIVLASDSATTLFGTTPQGKMVPLNVYNHANKIFNLRKGLPIGAMTAGAGSIGAASISTLAKDLRRELANLDENNYTILNVAERAKTFLYDERYATLHKPGAEAPLLTFMIGGYSSGEGLPEIYELVFGGKGGCQGPRLLQDKDTAGVNWIGETEAVARLLLGFGSRLPDVLSGILAGKDKGKVAAVMAQIQASLMVQLAPHPMPIQDAVNLAEFLVHTAINFSRFTPGPQTVGGPIEVAAITKHEGFKWVKRKHYFSKELNP